jgi:hypothetical protein
MKEFYHILKRLESRPAMWTGENSLKSIRTFLAGYSYAINEHDIPETEIDSGSNFHDWIANKFGFHESTAGWHNLILAVTIGLDPKNIEWEDIDKKATKEQHEKSVRSFYKLLEEFVNE